MVPADFTRYHRQMMLPEFGHVGQERLRGATIVIVGCGALGTVVAEQCVRAGVGTTTLVDRDLVDLTNLQRQTLYTESDALGRRPKAEAAKERLAQVNSSVRVRACVEEFGPSSALRITTGADLLIDCLDNFESRLLLNDVAVQRRVPMVYGGAVAMRGMAALLMPFAGGPCFRCLVPELPPLGSSESCDTAGVLSSATAIVASLEAALALRCLAQGAEVGERIANSLLRFDLADFSFGRTDLHAASDGECPCCQNGEFRYLRASMQIARRLCGRNAVQIEPSRAVEDGHFLHHLLERLRPHGDFTLVEESLRGQLKGEVSDSGLPVGLVVFRDGRVIVEGTAEPEFARSITARFVGG